MNWCDYNWISRKDCDIQILWQSVRKDYKTSANYHINGPSYNYISMTESSYTKAIAYGIHITSRQRQSWSDEVAASTYSEDKRKNI